MAVTDRKRRFIEALRSGLVGAAAARKAGYSAATAAQAASRLMKDPFVKDGVLNGKTKASKPGSKDEKLPGAPKRYTDAKEMLIDLMNEADDIKLRKEAAVALLPYQHQKLGEGGKKGAKDEAAKKAVNKFTSTPPPRLVVNNDKR